MKTPIAILASGTGSNFEAIIEAMGRGELEADVRLLISDRGDAPVLEKARARGIRALAIPPQAPPGVSGQDRRKAHEEEILKELTPLGIRFLVLAGYLRIVTPRLIEAFRSERGYARIVNIHPSLLPAFPGINAYQQAFQHGARLAGVTVHLVELDVDAGPICAQEAFAIGDLRSGAEVEKRGLEIEHRLYPKTLKWLLPEEFQTEDRGGRLSVRPN